MGKCSIKNKKKRERLKEKKSLEKEAINQTENLKATGKYDVDQLLEKAQDCLDTFNYDLAKKFCERALEADPTHLKALEMTGSLHLELGNQENAATCFQKAIELSPESGHSKYMYLGQMFTGAKAVELFQKGIEVMVKEKEAAELEEVAMAAAAKPEDRVSNRDISTAYCSIAELYMTDLCDEENAEILCQENITKAIEVDQENPEAFQLMASFKLVKGENETAREMIKKSLSLWLPKFKNFEKTNEDFDPVEVCPLIAQNRMQTAQILTEVEEYTDACDVLESLLDENDEDVQVWYMLGWVSHLQGEDYKGNSRHYLAKAKEVSQKIQWYDAPMLKHIDELLNELGPEPEVDVNEDNDPNNDDLDTDEEENVDEEAMEL